MTKLRGFTLIELLIVVAIIAILAAIAVPNFLEAQTRSKVSRVKSDHRSLATAIETYYIDNNTYPASTVTGSLTLDAGLYSAVPGTVGSTFRARNVSRLLTITTPIAYVTSNFPDPFADTRGIGFRYWTDQRGWVLGSFGPNVDERDGGEMLWNLANPRAKGGAGKWVNNTFAGLPTTESGYNGSVAQPSITLLAGGAANGSFTYDPSNGTISDGDTWRVKQ